MNKKKLSILVFLTMACIAGQVYWQCGSDETGSLLDSPMGIDPKEGAYDDLYIEDCVISGLDELSGGAGAVRNETDIDVRCIVGNLGTVGLRPFVQIFVSGDQDMDIETDSLEKSEPFYIGARERKAVSAGEIVIGDGPEYVKKYIAVYIDTDEENSGFTDRDTGNNWSKTFEIWISD